MIWAFLFLILFFHFIEWVEARSFFRTAAALRAFLSSVQARQPIYRMAPRCFHYFPELKEALKYARRQGRDSELKFSFYSAELRHIDRLVQERSQLMHVLLMRLLFIVMVVFVFRAITNLNELTAALTWRDDQDLVVQSLLLALMSVSVLAAREYLHGRLFAERSSPSELHCLARSIVGMLVCAFPYEIKTQKQNIQAESLRQEFADAKNLQHRLGLDQKRRLSEILMSAAKLPRRRLSTRKENLGGVIPVIDILVGIVAVSAVVMGVKT